MKKHFIFHSCICSSIFKGQKYNNSLTKTAVLCIKSQPRHIYWASGFLLCFDNFLVVRLCFISVVILVISLLLIVLVYYFFMFVHFDLFLLALSYPLES